MFCLGGDDILDDSSPQQQEPNLMIGGDELIEFEVVTTEEEEYLLSPTYTDGSTVYEPFDEGISSNIKQMSNFYKLEVDSERLR